MRVRQFWEQQHPDRKTLTKSSREVEPSKPAQLTTVAVARVVNPRRPKNLGAVATEERRARTRGGRMEAREHVLRMEKARLGRQQAQLD